MTKTFTKNEIEAMKDLAEATVEDILEDIMASWMGVSDDEYTDAVVRALVQVSIQPNFDRTYVEETMVEVAEYIEEEEAEEMAEWDKLRAMRNVMYEAGYDRNDISALGKFIDG